MTTTRTRRIPDTCINCPNQLAYSTTGRRCRACHIKFFLIPRNKSKEGRRLASISAKGRKQPRGEQSPKWKGDSVGIEQLHAWVRELFPKPKKCMCCKIRPPLDLANKGTYNRELKNWEWLCRKCHINGDGRIKRLHLAHRKWLKMGGYTRPDLLRKSLFAELVNNS
jgi:hypothetical protein